MSGGEQAVSGRRDRFCGCSRADSTNRRARPSCVLHGVSPEARAYRAGVSDALKGFATEVPEARRVRENDDEEYCRRCGGPNVTWSAASPLWNYVMRGNDINGPIQFADLVCMPCFIICAIQSGLPTIGWRLTLVPEPEGLIYVTPSGRVWDPAVFLWVEPEAAESGPPCRCGHGEYDHIFTSVGECGQCDCARFAGVVIRPGQPGAPA